MPKCRSDGNYALVQCLPSGGCWCVDPQGKPIPKTRVENGYGRPTCAQKSKSNQRRSSPRKLGVQTKKSECLVRVFVSHYISKHTHTHTLFVYLKLNEIGCLKEDRLAFNGNVIRVFVAEYTRSRQNMHNEKPVALSDKMIIDWKFSMLDSNHNRILEKYEYRELKRIVKKVRIGKILDELF